MIECVGQAQNAGQLHGQAAIRQCERLHGFVARPRECTAMITGYDCGEL
jgi:hypothetical protein